MVVVGEKIAVLQWLTLEMSNGASIVVSFVLLLEFTAV